VLRAQSAELLILQVYVDALQKLKEPKAFADYFKNHALVNRSARKLFEALLRKDHSLWPRLYNLIHKEMEPLNLPSNETSAAVDAKEAAAPVPYVKSERQAEEPAKLPNLPPPPSKEADVNTNPKKEGKAASEGKAKEKVKAEQVPSEAPAAKAPKEQKGDKKAAPKKITKASATKKSSSSKKSSKATEPKAKPKKTSKKVATKPSGTKKKTK
jgi:hypothetical protein